VARIVAIARVEVNIFAVVCCDGLLVVFFFMFGGGMLSWKCFSKSDCTRDFALFLRENE